jgi:hypothetical protein
MFKGPDTNNFSQTKGKAEGVIADQEAKLQELKERYLRIERWLRTRSEQASLLAEERNELSRRQEEVIKKVTANLDDPEAYEQFINSPELPQLKTQIATIDEKIRKISVDDNVFRMVWDLGNEFKSFESVAENSKTALTEDLLKLQEIEDDIAHLERDPNGEREQSHRKLDEDVEHLVRLRQTQLETVDKAEAMAAIVDSLDEEQRKVFLANMKLEDKKLFGGYRSHVLEQAHEREMVRQSERQDPELLKARVEQNQDNIDLKSIQKANKKFIKQTFELWNGNSTRKQRNQTPVLALPQNQPWDTMKSDIDPKKSGEYTLNPETQGLDFEGAKVFIPDLKKFEGRPLAEVAKHLISTYADRYHIPGIEYWKWLIENPDKSPQELKDGNYHFFFGSSLRPRDGGWGVPCFYWFAGGAGRWSRGARGVGDGWSPGYRVVLLEK